MLYISKKIDGEHDLNNYNRTISDVLFLGSERRVYYIWNCNKGRKQKNDLSRNILIARAYTTEFE